MKKNIFSISISLWFLSFFNAKCQNTIDCNLFKIDTIWNQNNKAIYDMSNKYYLAQIKGKEPFRKIRKYLPKYYQKYLSTLFLQNKSDYNRLDVTNGNLPHTQFNYFAINDTIAILSFNLGANDFEYINLIYVKSKSKFKLGYAINFKEKELGFEELCDFMKKNYLDRYSVKPVAKK